MDKLRVMIADDHSIIRMGMSALIGMLDDLEMVGEASDGRHAVTEALRLKPDVIVMDLMMPNKDGITATAEIKAALPRTRILILTTYTSTDGIQRALNAGADGAVFKSDASKELITAIRHVASGQTFVSPAIKRQFASDPPAESLTPRQSQILESLARGLSNNDIAIQHAISLPRVKQLVTDICAKLGAANRAEAVAIALRKCLIKI